MPIALIIVLLDVFLVYHAVKTGRVRPWAFIILMAPLVGSLAYIVIELVPEWFASPEARQARQRIANRFDPEKRYRELTDQLAIANTVANRAALADECQRVARFDEAVQHYDHILNSPLGDDPAYAFHKAQAQFSANHHPEALATLDDLQKRWPDYQSAEAHLLYARTLAEVGRTDEALEEYQAVGAYFLGAEARVRHGILLQMVGRVAEARMVFNELLIQMRRAPNHVRKAQAEWLSIAEKHLSP